jgi:hypothetical protein
VRPSTGARYNGTTFVMVSIILNNVLSGSDVD